jgi:hypothetical protein
MVPVTQGFFQLLVGERGDGRCAGIAACLQTQRVEPRDDALARDRRGGQRRDFVGQFGTGGIDARRIARITGTQERNVSHEGSGSADESACRYAKSAAKSAERGWRGRLAHQRSPAGMSIAATADNVSQTSPLDVPPCSIFVREMPCATPPRAIPASPDGRVHGPV